MFFFLSSFVPIWFWFDCSVCVDELRFHFKRSLKFNLFCEFIIRWQRGGIGEVTAHGPLHLICPKTIKWQTTRWFEIEYAFSLKKCLLTAYTNRNVFRFNFHFSAHCLLASIILTLSLSLSLLLFAPFWIRCAKQMRCNALFILFICLFIMRE